MCMIFGSEISIVLYFYTHWSTFIGIVWIQSFSITFVSIEHKSISIPDVQGNSVMFDKS